MRSEIDADLLVPGDVVLLDTGTKVLADMRVLQQNNLQVNESVLTGEWVPVDKESITLVNRRPITEQVNMVWKGTTVVSGTGYGVVVGTGSNTAIGKIAAHLSETETKTPLNKQIQKLAQWIMVLVLLSVVVIISIALWLSLIHI